jgi:hypothetical protein
MNTRENSVTIIVDDVEMTLLPLDSGDVALTMGGARLVRKAARMVFGARMTGIDVEELSLKQVVELFTDLVCWEEKSGRLFICADLPDRCFCLPIPPEHWKVMTRGQKTH